MASGEDLKAPLDGKLPDNVGEQDAKASSHPLLSVGQMSYTMSFMHVSIL